MTRKKLPKCSDCGQPIQGESVYCLACFRKRHRPCPACMRCTFSGVWLPRTVGWRNVNCPACRNERYILV